MSDIVSVYATFASDEEARRIGRQVVEERLAACVNVLGPCHSIYRWEGEVQSGEEVPAIFKTSSATADRLIARVTELHSYDLPAITAWPVAKSPGLFRMWIENGTG